jgi:hypothetical protein
MASGAFIASGLFITFGAVTSAAKALGVSNRAPEIALISNDAIRIFFIVRVLYYFENYYNSIQLENGQELGKMY